MSAPRIKPKTRLPPFLSDLWSDVRSLLGPLVVYWVLLVGCFGSWVAVTVTDTYRSPDDWMWLSYFGILTFGGVGLGQALTILRVRDWVLFSAWAFTWTFGAAFGLLGMAAIGAAVGPLMIFMVLAIFFGPMFIMAGAWSLRTGKDLFGTWVPLLYATATTIRLAERSGRVYDWYAGDKYAIWDVTSLALLLFTITLLLAFVIMRERRRLYLWNHAPGGLLRPKGATNRKARPGLNLMGWVLVVMLGVGLTAGSAIVGPYLWRTGRPPRDDGHGGYGGTGTEQTENGQGQGQGEGKGQGKKESTGEQVARETTENMKPMNSRDLQQAGQPGPPQQGGGVDLWSTLFLSLLLTLLALLTFWRPVRRILIVRHLRKPLWELPPTQQVDNLWRLVEIALADAGVEVVPGEPAVQLAERAGQALQRLANGHVQVPGLTTAAAVRDRVTYGLGVGEGDLVLMADVADDAFETVWLRLDDRGQLRAMYRRV